MAIAENFKAGVVLSRSATIEDDFPIARRQGHNLSCGCFAVVSAVEYVLKQSKILSREYILSERFLYYMARRLQGFKPDDDLGTTIEYVLDAAFRYGVATEKSCPYYSNMLYALLGFSNICEKPSERAFAEASHFRISAFKKINPTIYNLKVALSVKFPVIVVFHFSESTFNLTSAYYTGVAHVTAHKPTQQHACVLVGYNDETGMFKFRNTWDGFLFHWGDHGYGYIPYRFVKYMIVSAFIVSAVKSSKAGKQYLISLKQKVEFQDRESCTCQHTHNPVNIIREIKILNQEF